MKKVDYHGGGHILEPENANDAEFLKQAVEHGVVGVIGHAVEKWTVSTTGSDGVQEFYAPKFS